MGSQAILVVEDDEDLRLGLAFALRQDGYDVVAVETTKEALHVTAARRIDLLILDVMLPDGSGFDLCANVRAGRHGESAPAPGIPEHEPQVTPSDVPVVFLTARDDEIDVVRGLELGADDYIAKPFRLRELLSRVKARLRRNVADRTSNGGAAPAGSGGTPAGAPAAGASVPTPPLTVDAARAVVYKRGIPVQLTASEYRLFLAFTEHPGQTLTRDQLADRLLGIDDALVDDNTVSVYIRRLRSKLEDEPSRPRHIVTVRGIGYRYEEHP